MTADASSASPPAGVLPALVAVGLVAGLTASVFGVGGGIVMVPLLIALLHYDPKRAAATSLAAIIFTATVGAASHGVLGNVDWDRAMLIGVPAMAGVTIGVAMRERISSAALTYGFALLMVLVAARMVFAGDPQPAELPVAAETLGVAALGIAAGTVAGLFGVGGGVIFVPALVIVLGMGQLDAEATSLVAIIPVALLGSWQNTRRGAVHWRHALIIGAVSVVTAIGGALIAEASPQRALQIGFACLLVATAVQLARRAARG